MLKIVIILYENMREKQVSSRELHDNIEKHSYQSLFWNSDCLRSPFAQNSHEPTCIFDEYFYTLSILIITPMRRLALIVLTLSWTLSSYASTPDSRIHITLPTGLSSTVATTLQSEIESKMSKEILVPESISAKSIPVSTSTPMMAMDTIDAIDPTNWEQTIDVTRVYSDTRITSLLITTYEYTG